MPTASAARPSRISRSRRSAARARASRSACGGAQQRVGAAVQRAGPLLGGAQRQPGVHLGLPGARGPPRRAARARLVSGSSSGASSAAASRASSSASPARSRVAGLLGAGDRRGRAARPRPRADAGLRAVLAELLGDRGQRGVGLVQLGQRDVDPLLGVVRARPRARDRSKPSRSAAAVASASWAVGLVDGRLDLDQARLASRSRRRRSGRRARRRRGSPRSRRAASATSARAAARSSTTAHLEQQPGQRGAQVGRARRRRRRRTSRRPGRPGQSRSVDAVRRRAAARRGRGRRP